MRKNRWFCVFKRSDGFTLLQVIVLITALAAMAVFAAVSVWGAISTYRLNSALASMLSDIRYAQHMARTHNGWYGIIVHPDPVNSYSVYFTDGVNDLVVLRPSDQSRQLNIDVEDEYGGVTITSVDLAGGNKVEFDPQGTPYDDMSGASFSADGSITLAVGGKQRTIRIIKNTGRIELQ